jgi:hypothetical protein
MVEGNYYVSAVDAGRTWLMAGPYKSHVEALATVDKALKIADEKDGRAWFMAWGTVRVASNKLGVLNRHGFI